MSDINLPEPQLEPIANLRRHPRNYRNHPADQLDHLMESMREHGFYRNVVATADGTILAGHGVVEAAKKLGMSEVRVIKIDISPDSPQALKILTGDNQIAQLAEIDDRALTDILRELSDVDSLLGTGYDDQMLAALIYTTRPATEIADADEAARVAGMTEHSMGEKKRTVIVQFLNREDRLAFLQMCECNPDDGNDRPSLSIWWPNRELVDLQNVLVTENDND